MKTILHLSSPQQTKSRLLSLGAILALAISVPTPVQAATNTPCASEGRVLSVPFMGNMFPKGDGTFQVRNSLLLIKTDSTDALIAGRKTVALNGDFPAGLNYGTVIHELGTWNLADTNNPVFTPSGPYWEGTWQGASQTNGSVRYESLYRGHGGSIDGLVYEETTVRGPTSSPYDPAVPVEYSGTYGPEEALGQILADDFTRRDPRMTFQVNAPSASFSTDNNQAVISAHFIDPTGDNNTGAWATYPAALNLSEGKVVAMRVDLVYADGPDGMFHLGCMAGYGTYLAFVGKDYVGLDKFGASSGHSFFFLERPKIPLTNVVLSLALSRSGDNVVLTTQIEDKAPGKAVFFQKTVMDTPAADSCVIGQVELEKGVYMHSVRDVQGKPWTALNRPYFGLWQNTDGAKPPVKAVFDKFMVAMHDLPPLQVQRAVLVSWPATAFPFCVEATSSLEGSQTLWRPVLEPVIEHQGFRQVTIPTTASGEMGYLRLK